MWNNAWQVRLRFIGVAVLFFCCVFPAHANWSENFNGGFQQTWQFDDVEDSDTFSAASVNGQLVLTDTKIPIEGGAQTGFGVVFESFSDVRMTGIINPGNDGNINDSVGLLIRGNFLNQSFYMAEINYSARELIIYRNGGPDGNSNIVIEPIPDLEFTDSVYVEIEAIGDDLQAWAYDAPGGTLRATASVTDTSFSSGISGVLVNENEGGLPMLGVWDDLTVEAILRGDFNNDGNVDGKDFLLWQQGVTANPLSLEELAAWEADFGTVALAGLSSAPEPSSLLLAGGAAILAAGMRSRRRSFGR